MSYNAEHEWQGSTLVIRIIDLYYIHEESHPGNSWKVANITDRSNPRMQFTFNAYKPKYYDMDPEQGYNYKWEQRGNSIYITVVDIDRDYGPSRSGKTNLVCHMQQGVGNNVVAQMTGYRS